MVNSNYNSIDIHNEERGCMAEIIKEKVRAIYFFLSLTHTHTLQAPLSAALLDFAIQYQISYVHTKRY
jgi:hypothetical protein